MNSNIAKLMLVLAALLVTPVAGAVTYTYDDLNRLASITFNSGPPQIYTYDAAGNLLSIASGSAASTTSTTTTTTTTVVGTTTTTQVTGGSGKPGDLSIPLTLAQGWNLLGNSVNQSLSFTLVFVDPTLVTTIWKLVPGTGRWAFHAPSLNSIDLAAFAANKSYDVLSSIGPGKGYWVNAKVAATLITQTGGGVQPGIGESGSGLESGGDGPQCLAVSL